MKNKNVVFCFLLYDTIDHLKIWENFFSQSFNCEIVSHLKTITEKTPGWIKKSAVSPVPTGWCAEGLINAFSQMIKKGLKNKNNQYFVLLSGSCIPLYDYYTTFKKIIGSKKSRMEYYKIPDNVFEGTKDILNGHQWVLLNKKNAKDYSRLSIPSDKKATKFLKSMRQVYSENGVKVGENPAIVDENTNWVGGCPDEIYPINWFNLLYGKNLRKNISNKPSTYTHWDFIKDPKHPTIFDLKKIKRNLKTIYDSNCIFARKFTKDAVEYITSKCHKKTSTFVKKELVGRLGNQMFQYASSLGIANIRCAELCIEPSSYEDDLRNEKEDLVNVCEVKFKKCKNLKYKNIPEKGYGIYDISPFLKSKKNINIKTNMDTGFLQSWKYFEPIKELIKKRFTFISKIRNKAENIIKKYGKYKLIGIHVRRGDLVDLKYLNFPPLEYFKKAKKFFKDKYKGEKIKFIVATNDKKWVKQNLLDKDTFLIEDTQNAPEDMCLLTKCNDVIMSIGTFSWWSGYLCPGDVIYYENEINLKHRINKGKILKEDYYPPYWIGIN
jgi:galactoside 2-L-fucosyltransferase 1/2